MSAPAITDAQSMVVVTLTIPLVEVARLNKLMREAGPEFTETRMQLLDSLTAEVNQ